MIENDIGTSFDEFYSKSIETLLILEKFPEAISLINKALSVKNIKKDELIVFLLNQLSMISIIEKKLNEN